MPKIIDCGLILNQSKMLDKSPTDRTLALYQFGSTLAGDAGEDVDMLMVYASGQEIEAVLDEKNRVLALLCDMFPGSLIDLTALSEKEAEESRFLERSAAVPIYERFRGLNSLGV